MKISFVKDNYGFFIKLVRVTSIKLTPPYIHRVMQKRIAKTVKEAYPDYNLDVHLEIRNYEEVSLTCWILVPKELEGVLTFQQLDALSRQVGDTLEDEMTYLETLVELLEANHD